MLKLISSFLSLEYFGKVAIDSFCENGAFLLTVGSG